MTQPQILPRTLRDRAESFFAAPLADVEVVADPEVAALGAAAYACGRRVRLAPRVADLTRGAHLAVLAHELAHVVQQAEGRTPVTGRLAGGLPANDDSALEAEADELARRFVAGGPPRRRTAPAGPPAAVVQRTVTVGGVYLAGVSALGEKERQVLSLIEDGENWLAWAVGASGPPYPFATPEALVEAVQTGLHGSPLMLLPRLALLVSPRKLMSLDESALHEIRAWEKGNGEPPDPPIIHDEPTPQRIRRVLHRNELWTQRDLANGREFLKELKVRDRPVFQVLGLLDQLALLELFSDSETPFGRDSKLEGEAAEFALRLPAVTPFEFIDYLQLYLSTIEKLGGKNVPKERRLSRALGIVEEIRPFLQGWLRCPGLAQPPAPAALPGLLRDWIAGGNLVGFARLSAAASQVYQESDLRQQSGEEAKRIVDRYMAATQHLLSEAELVRHVLLQDGATRFYQLEAAAGHAKLTLDAAGNLTLSHCHLRKPE